MPLRAIVFDFDGVIANSEPLHFRALRDVVSGAGISLSEAEYYARYLGYDDVGALNAIAADHHRRWSIDEVAVLVDRKSERLAELELDASLLFPGAEAAIRRTAAAVPIAIASGALRGEILRLLDRIQLTSLFTAIVGAEDAPASKPAPDPYLRAVALLEEARGMRLGARECIAVEDSRWGLVSAQAAGLRTVGVTHTYPAAELTSADLVVGSLDELTLEALSAICAE